jgi:hypothetical protein
MLSVSDGHANDCRDCGNGPFQLRPIEWMFHRIGLVAEGQAGVVTCCSAFRIL